MDRYTLTDGVRFAIFNTVLILVQCEAELEEKWLFCQFFHFSHPTIRRFFVPPRGITMWKGLSFAK